MRTQKFQDIRRKASPTREAISRRWVKSRLLGMSLRDLRKAAGKTQAGMSAATEMAQGELSKIERRDDHLVSTLRKYAKALGGELEVSVRFPDKKTVRLRGV